MKLIEQLRRAGVLRQSEAIERIVGAPVRGSWWSHPRGRAIFRALSQLADHPDVATTKWIDGKVTFVHRRKWPELLASARAADARGLSPAARALWRRVKRAGAVEASGKAALELEQRLLVYAEQFHSESGAHRKRLESWEHWHRRVSRSKTS